jgi:hypothetical protein
MKLTVWKFHLPITGAHEIDMPAGAEVLCAGAQFDYVMIWARVDPSAPMEKRVFHVVGTGDACPAGKYIGTAFKFDGEFVWHVFEGDT